MGVRLRGGATTVETSLGALDAKQDASASVLLGFGQQSVLMVTCELFGHGVHGNLLKRLCHE